MLSFVKKIIHFLIPPENWQPTVFILVGILIGLTVYLVYISRAPSYLSDNPKTCVNCHVMSSQFSSWSHSSHRICTNCNDCHVPQNNLFSHYFFKAKDGLRHSTVFTLRREPQVMMIRQAGINTVQENCKRCHIKVISNVSILNVTGKNHSHGTGKLCWECHSMTPHTHTNSLSSAPFAFVPLPGSPVPDWLKKLLNKE